MITQSFLFTDSIKNIIFSNRKAKNIIKILFQMGWYKQHSSFSENPFNKPTVDRCINCGQTKEVKTTITMEFGEGNYNTGPICKDCYSANHGPRILEI